LQRHLAGAAATTSVALAALLAAGTLSTVTSPAGAAPVSPRERVRQSADKQLAAHKGELRAGAKDAFTRRTEVLDTNGAGHVRYDRSYAGLPVLGGDIVVHVASEGAFRGFSAQAKGLDVATAPALTRAAAETAARGKAGSTRRTVDATSSRLVVDATSGRAALAYDVLVTGRQADTTPSRYHVLVDARTGVVRSAYDEVDNGTGNSLYDGSVAFSTTRNATTGLYEMKDAVRTGGNTTDLKGATTGTGTLFTDADDVWGNGAVSDRATAAVDASYGAEKTFDFYKNVLGRAGIYNNGTGVRSRVHYGTNYNNAFWDGTQMTYGDGPSNTRPLVSLDVAGHEMSHGVTENSANLTYSGESGGLNEATSDIFGTSVEFYAANPSDPGDYLIGEKLGTPFRYMDQPSRDGGSADCWSATVGTLDVHYSSGPANHLFYLLSEGSGAKTINGVAYNSPTCDASTVTGIGRDAASKIWYRALTTYMTSSTNYAGARTAAVKAATDLYGATSTQCAGVASAFSAINVTGTTCTTTTPPPPTGNLVKNPGFESGATSWTASTGVVNNDATRAHAGSWEAWLNGYGATHTDTLSQAVTVPAATTATLSLWLRIDTKETGTTPYDTFKVQVVSGTTTTTLATYSNANAGGYLQRTLNLSSFVGKSVTLKFVGAEDSSLSTSFLVDDVSVTTA
jgi:Zn-dependent metalloprotease